MTTYTWQYGDEGSGIWFSVVFDTDTNKFTLTALEGTIDLSALWFSDADSVSDGYTLVKSDNNLNMNGTNVVWEDDGTASSEKFVWDNFLKDGVATTLTAGQSQVLTAPAGFDPEEYTVLGVRATTSVGSIKWVDESAQQANAPALTVDDETVDLPWDAVAGVITGADVDATDADGDAVTFALVGTVPADGSGNPLFSVDSDGQISLTAEGAAYIGGSLASFKSYEVSVQASDGSMTSNIGTITIDVAPPSSTVLLFDGSGAFVGQYAKIQDAINAGSAGYTVFVGAGTYADPVNINKAITLIGANSGVAGIDDRATESVISGKITVNAAATIDGFKILNTTANTTAYDAIQVQTSGAVVIENNVFYSTGANGSNTTIDRAVYITTAATGTVTVDDNLFTGAQTTSFGDANWTSAVWSDGRSSDLQVTDNTFQFVRTAMNLDGYDSTKTTVSGNDIEAAGTGISVGANAVGASLTFEGITDNTFGAVGTDFNLQNVGSTKSITLDLGTTANLATAGQTMTVLGGGGGDTITGTSGQDSLTGNAGNDNLLGGLGADAFVFNRALSAATNVDTIGDFSGSSGQGDKIVLDDAIFTGLTAANLATDFGTKVLYDSTSGALSFDSDGAGGNAAIQFATLTGAPELTAADFLII